MSDWPSRDDKWGLGFAISAAHPLSLGGMVWTHITASTALSSLAWPAANRAILIPFRLPKIATVYRATISSGSTASGNFDVGVYDYAGNRIVSSGTQAKGANTETNVDLTDTAIGPGLYYMAMSADGTNNYGAVAPSNLGLVKAAGIIQASTAFVLPSTVTFETAASAYIPGMILRFRSYT